MLCVSCVWVLFVVLLCSVVCRDFCLICDACGWCSFVGNMGVSSCRCCVLVSVVHHLQL